MKKIVFSLMIFLMVILMASALGEAGFRIRDMFDRNRGLRNSVGDINRRYCHGLKPNSRFRLIASKKNEYNVPVCINNFGFRGKDILKNKRPGVARIMVMGDSFTFGVGARENETIPFLIEERLLAKGREAEVINAGFGHYSPLLHYLKLKDEYMEFKPDMVIYLFDFSDLADDWRFERNLVYDKFGRIVRCDPAFVDGRRDWWKTMRIHSKLCVYIHNKVVRLFDKIRILGLKGYITAKMNHKRAKALIVTGRGKSEVTDTIVYDGYLMIRGRDKLPDIMKHFKRTEKYLNLIKYRLAEDGIPMVLVIYPYGIHVGPAQWGEGRAYWGFKKGKAYDDYYAFDILEDYARRNNLPCINVLPDFLKRKERKLFFDIDGHFTPEANSIVAEAITSNGAFDSLLNAVCGRRDKTGIAK
ncbi:MAG: hypothetical protein JW994_02620 [Candidatus Omnitrophica bacterium]|nr:hypothetical protein [Candidatus Omnitrophota bacterium]